MERQGGEQGLCAPVARDFRPRLLHTRKGCEGTVFRQAAGSLSREMGGMRALPGQKIGARRAEHEQYERDRSSAGVGRSVAVGRIPRKVAHGSGTLQTRSAGAVGAGPHAGCGVAFLTL